MVAEISHLTIFKMSAVRHLEFLKVSFFEQLHGKLWRTEKVGH